MSNPTLKSFSQSKSNLENFLDSTDDAELDDVSLLAVNGGSVQQELTDINTNSQALIKSVVSKVPTDAQSIAQSLADGLTKVINQASDDFGVEA